MRDSIPMRRFFMLLGLVTSVELLLMLLVAPLMEARGYPVWLRAVTDAGLLALICVPFLLNFQLRPLQMTYYDLLTGLPNRQLFDDRLLRIQAVAKRARLRFAVAFLDLDDFKPVNDRLGHRVGDVVLKQVAVRIESVLRESDTVARVGGDEFALLLQDTETLADAERVICKIRRALALPIKVPGQTVRIGVSAGVAFFPVDGESGVALLEAMDTAMYRNKQRRKSQGEDWCADPAQ